MKKAMPTKDEHQRLQALEEYSILDTPQEIDLDEITEIAAHICQTPVALISLVDKDRQWFKSRVGLNVAQTPRDISFCGHAIQNDSLFIVENTLVNEDFKDNPLVLNEPHIEFYAGMPLKSSKGYNIGTLCVIDYQPRQLSSEQKKILNILSKNVIRFLELKKQNNFILENELRLIQYAKMSALGTMVSNIAHEVNNPLSVMQGRLSLLIQKIKNIEGIDKEDTLSSLAVLKKMGERISKVIIGLRRFSHETMPNEIKVMTPIKFIMQETFDLCREKLEENNIKVELYCDEKIQFKCHEIQISQVLLNLMMNSYEALLVNQDSEKWIKIRAFTDEGENNLLIHVINNGPKIPNHVGSRLMEPFFTTKKVGYGAGLGLSISKGIVESHGGSLSYDDSEPYTCFTMKFSLSTK